MPKGRPNCDRFINTNLIEVTGVFSRVPSLGNRVLNLVWLVIPGYVPG